MGIMGRIEAGLEARREQQAASTMGAFLAWLSTQGVLSVVVERGAVVDGVLCALEAGSDVTWGAFQEACRGALWLASLASNNGFIEVGRAFDTMYERLGVLAGYEEGVSE